MDELTVHSFGARLKMARNSADLTIKEAAEIIGCSDRNYAAYESGDKKPSLDRLPLIATGFNTSLDSLILGSADNAAPLSPRQALRVLTDLVDQVEKMEGLMGKLFELEQSGWPAEVVGVMNEWSELGSGVRRRIKRNWTRGGQDGEEAAEEG